MKYGILFILAVAAFPLMALAGEAPEGPPANPVTGKVNFGMKYDPSFGGIFLRNADFVDYVVEIDWVDGTVQLSYTTLSGHEGNVLPAGKEVTMPVRTGTWRIMGDNGNALPLDIKWSAVGMVTLRPYGDDETVGMEAVAADDEETTVPLMTPMERAKADMPRVVKLPPEESHPAPIDHPFGLLPRSRQLLDYMREHDPEGYKTMKQQFEARFPDRKLPE